MTSDVKSTNVKISEKYRMPFMNDFLFEGNRFLLLFVRFLYLTFHLNKMNL